MKNFGSQTITQKDPQPLELPHLQPYHFEGEPDRRPLRGGSAKRPGPKRVKTTGRYADVANTKLQIIVSPLDRINNPEKDNGPNAKPHP